MNKSSFKKHQRWIALLVAFSFAWLLQVTAMPLAAVDTNEQVAAASAGQATGFVEQEGDDWERAMPRTAPILLILGVVVLSFLYLLIHGIRHHTAPEW